MYLNTSHQSFNNQKVIFGTALNNNMWSQGGLDTWISLTETLTEDERLEWASVRKCELTVSDFLWQESRSIIYPYLWVKASVMQCLLSRLKARLSSLPADHAPRSQFLSEYTENGFMVRCFDFGAEKRQCETPYVTHFATSCVCIIVQNPSDSAVTVKYLLYNLCFIVVK